MNSSGSPWYSSAFASASRSVITMAAWRPRPSGRGGNAASPPSKCRRYPIVCSYVPVPAHPRPCQEAVLRDHCGHARYVWNLAVEQHSHWHPGRKSAPGYLKQCRQLTQARADNPWLAAGSQTVQQQALRDFTRAMKAFFDRANPAGRPSWRKAGRDEGFRIVGRHGRQWDVRRLSRKIGEVWVPKAGWVRFRWSRAVPPGAKSYRVTMNQAGRWHVAFAAIPAPVPAPGNSQAVGIDRGVAISAALSTGQLLHAPALTAREWIRLRRLQRTLARAKRGSNRRGHVKHAIG